jgi:hypothetical protein
VLGGRDDVGSRLAGGRSSRAPRGPTALVCIAYIYRACLQRTPRAIPPCTRPQYAIAAPRETSPRQHTIIMDPNITKSLNDKLYDKRKSGALELEGLIRDALIAQDHDRIAKIVHQLCNEYAYAVHQPHARNGGLIGLAAASIALGPVGAHAP